MALLKHGDFEFHNILRGGYKILPNKPEILSEVVMADGTKKRNYGEMPKTRIKVKFGKLDRETYREYISHFELPEDNYTYCDTDTGEMLTKKFFVTRPEDILDYIDDIDEEHEEFEILLEQCGEA